jgi:hypothetical protein
MEERIVNRLIIVGIGALALALALLAAGCGGGGTDEATAQVSKAEFFKQARAICVKTQKKIQVEFNTSKDPTAVLDTAASLLENEAEELEAIDGSDAVEEEVKPLIDGVFGASHLIAQKGSAGANAPSVQAYKKEASALHLSKC